MFSRNLDIRQHSFDFLAESSLDMRVASLVVLLLLTPACLAYAFTPRISSLSSLQAKAPPGIQMQGYAQKLDSMTTLEQTKDLARLLACSRFRAKAKPHEIQLLEAELRRRTVPGINSDQIQDDWNVLPVLSKLSTSALGHDPPSAAVPASSPAFAAAAISKVATASDTLASAWRDATAPVHPDGQAHPQAFVAAGISYASDALTSVAESWRDATAPETPYGQVVPVRPQPHPHGPPPAADASPAFAAAAISYASDALATVTETWRRETAPTHPHGHMQ